MLDQEIIKGKFKNIFLKLVVGIMSNDLDNVKHFLSEEVYKKYSDMINNNISNNEIRCLDEPNVKEIEIVKIEQDDKYDIVYARLVSRYMDYYIDLDTGEYKRGINDHRIEISHDLILKKNKDVQIMNIAVKCPSCGANLDPNNSGYCKYCGKTNSAESYDFVLYEVSNL